MIQKQFGHIRPVNVTEALTVLEDKGSDVRILAGGTDLLVRMHKGVLGPTNLMSLRDLPLEFIVEKNGLAIGSTTTLDELVDSPLVRENYTALWEAIRQIGAVQVRNRATLGGNICNAAPSADSAPPLLVYNAYVEAVSLRGTRSIPINKFFVGPGRTDLQPQELVTSISLPAIGPGTSSAYVKMRRTAEDIALVGVAVFLAAGQDGKVRELRVAVGAAAPTPILVSGIDSITNGARMEELDMAEICGLAVAAASPIDDVRSSAAYRRTLVGTLTKRAILMAVQRNPFYRLGGDICGESA